MIIALHNLHCRVVALTFVAGLILCQLALAQEEAGSSQKKEPADKTATRITVGSSSGMPGDPLMLPIYFSPGEGVQVGTFKLAVNFVSANLKFDKLERGIAAEQGNVELTSNLETGKNDKGVETSTIHIQASLSSPDAKKGIPQGLLGYLTLRISSTGKPANITLRTSAEASEVGSGKPVPKVQVSDAQIEVIATGTEPAVACFFFTH